MKTIKYLILDDKDNIILSTIEEDKKEIIYYIKDKNKLITFKDYEYRTSQIIQNKIKIYAYTNDKQLIRSSRSFNTQLNIIINSIDNLKYLKKEVEKEVYRHVNILIHNLITINAHDMQEMFNFISQSDLSNNTKRAKKFIEEKIIENPIKASSVFLKLMKSNIETKTEFSVFSKLYEDNPILNYKNYNIRDVLLNIMYNFFSDLTDKNVELDIKSSSSKAYFDYESIQVALFHMIDNTIKYIKDDTKLTIEFIDLINQVDIIFNMISLKVDDEEKKKIFIEGFSSKTAKKNGKAGKGIGMSRVKQILVLNNGDINLTEGTDCNMQNTEYANNIFKISLRKENYSI
jgi:K+-sensing histidine kinase KdpD